MIINIARKELKSLFASPMGWIILALLMFGFGFTDTLGFGTQQLSTTSARA